MNVNRTPNSKCLFIIPTLSLDAVAMTAGPRAKSNRNNLKGGKIAQDELRSGAGMAEDVVFDIGGLHYPIIPPRTSSLARGTGFEPNFHAAMTTGASASTTTSSSSAAVVAGSGTPRQQDTSARPPSPPHTPRAVVIDDTSAMSTPGAGTSAMLPTPATMPTGNTPFIITTDDHDHHAQAQALAPLMLPLVDRHHHSPGSSQGSLVASRSSVSQSAAHGSSLATSWTNERNTDGLSGHGHGDGDGDHRVKEEEHEEEVEESMIKSREVIDLVGGESEEVGSSERESEDVWMHGRAREAGSISRLPLSAQAETGSRMAQGEGLDEEDNVVPADMTDSAWHPLGDDPLSKEDPSPFTTRERTREDIRRASIQFSEGCSSDAEEKRRHVRRQRSSLKLSASEKLEQLRLKLKAPPSPQPWEFIDHPVNGGTLSQDGHQERNDGEKGREHGGHEPLGSDYYSTLTSKNFATMQKRYVNFVVCFLIADVYFSLCLSFVVSPASRRRPPIPHSSYYFGLPPPDCAYGTPPVGHIGVHHPREIIRIERDYASGEVVQFTPIYPLELEGRVGNIDLVLSVGVNMIAGGRIQITPTQFHETINDINEILISAYSIRHSFVYNLFAIATLQLSTLLVTSHYTKVGVFFLVFEKVPTTF